MVPVSAQPVPLPLGLVPVPGESLGGFLLSLAEHLDTAPGEVARRAGLAEGRAYAPGTCNAELTAGQAATLASVARIEPGRVRGMLLSSYAGVLYREDTADAVGWLRPEARAWAWLARTRVCPRCLAESVAVYGTAVWRTAWRTGWSFACVRHECLLVDTCPEGHVLGVGNASRQGRLIASPRVVGRSADCRWGVGTATICGAPLDGQDAQAAAASLFGPAASSLIVLQRRLDALFSAVQDGTGVPEAPTSLGRTVDHAQHLRDLRVLTVLYDAVRLDASPAVLPVEAQNALVHQAARPEADDAENTRHRLPFPAAALQGAMLATAAHHLAMPAADGAAEIRKLALACFKRDRVLLARIRHGSGLSAGLKAALLTDLRNPLGPTRLLQTSAGAGSGLDTCRIPAYLPAGNFREHFAWIGQDERRVRRCTAVALLRLADGSGIDGAAAALGMPLESARTGTTRLTRMLRAEDGLARYQQAVLALAAQWAARDDLPDYRERRSVLREWELAPDRWTAFVEERMVDGSQEFRRGDTAGRRLAASVYLWSRITGGEAIYHPLVLRQRAAKIGRAERVIEKVAQLAHSPSIAGRLDGLALRLTVELGL